MPGNVEIRFSVQNAEVVRQALEKLGKDGDKALRQLDAASQRPGGGLKSLSAVVEELRGRATGFAFSLGPLGTGLVALGPVGLAVAASLGVVVAAFNAASEKANAFAENARRTKEAAQTAGLTISQFKLLSVLGGQIGLDSDQTSKFIDKLTLSVEELRRGGGALFDALLRIDEGLVRQVASARDTAGAIDIVAQAYQRLNDQGQRNALAKAVGGRGGVQGGQLLDVVAEKGGLQAIERGAREAGKAIDEGLLDRTAKLKVEIDAIKRRSDGIWAKAFAEDVLQQQKRSAEFWERIANAVAAVQEWWNRPSAPSSPASWFAGQSQRAMANRGLAAQTPFGESGVLAGAPPSVTSPFQTTLSRESSAVSASVQLALTRQWASVLGNAITPTEQMKLKILELNAAQEKGGVSDAVRARALGAFTLELDRAGVATRTSIGVVTEEELLRQKLRDLDDMQAKGFFSAGVKGAEEMAAAVRLVRKEVKETMDSVAVRRSEFPALARLSIDAADLKKNLDEGLSGALRGSTQTLLEMANGTKTLGAGLSELSSRILEAVANALLMKTVVAPLAGALSGGLSGLFGGSETIGASGIGLGGTTSITLPGLFGSARGNVFAGGQLVPFAQGGIVNRPTIFPFAGGMGLMGEAGPEGILPLRRLGNGRLGVESAGGGTPIYVTHQVINNHPGARVNTRDEEDGRGGRKTVTVIDEIVAAAAGRPGSRISQALRGSQFVARR